MVSVNNELQLFIGHRKGHYTGYAADLKIIVTGLRNVQEGDILKFTLINIYNNANVLPRGTTIHEHTIPSNTLSLLDVGDYEIIATLNDGQQIGTAQYSVVQLPEIIFTSLTPDTLQIPMHEPVSIIGKWNVQGMEMHSISGSCELHGLTASINQLN